MKFAVVLHGPEVLDTGLGQKVMRLLRDIGQVVTVMSGFTGVAAVVDAGLEKEIDISRRRKPSVELAHLDAEVDYLLLVNCAKNRESALRFGSIVFSRCGSRISKPFIQVDDGLLIDWSGKGGALAEKMAARLDLEKVIVPDHQSLERHPKGWRCIGGIVSGESVWINGVVVGKATSESVLIGKDGKGRLVAQGIALKETGVKRLGDFDVYKAHVRSGLTRRTAALPRTLDSEKKGTFLVDHSAEDAVYRCRDAALVVTIGDDTSRICGALLYRFNVPVVAIIDGDEDGISKDTIKLKGSIIIRVRSGTDDLVGADVRKSLFQGSDYLDRTMTAKQAAEEIVRLAGERLIDQQHIA